MTDKRLLHCIFMTIFTKWHHVSQNRALVFKPFAPADASAPPIGLLLGEVRVLSDWRRGGRIGPALRVPREGDGRAVLVLPGFFASDRAMVRLRRTIRAAGYTSYGWGPGRNFGVKSDTLARIDARIDRIEQDVSGPVTLVGWSLGGLMAREYAKYAPHRVEKVITLGSPFSGDPRANHAWRVYELVARHPVDAPPIAVCMSEKPPVHTTAIWSRNDGLIAPASARGEDGERDDAVEVKCGHLGFPSDEMAIRAVLAAIRN
jgi:pimeloyl-ACP methyl ester carboxylesterase